MMRSGRRCRAGSAQGERDGSQKQGKAVMGQVLRSSDMLHVEDKKAPQSFLCTLWALQSHPGSHNCATVPR